MQRGSTQIFMGRLLLSCAAFLWLVSGWMVPEAQMAFGQTHPSPTRIADAASPTYDLASLEAELRRISGFLGKHPSKDAMVALRDSLPKRWAVTTPEGAYAVSTQPLRNQLTALSAEKAKLWVDSLTEEIEASSKASGAAPSSARAKLDGILARKEFAAVRPPSQWELLQQRIEAWLLSLLENLFRAIGRHPIGGQILFWAIVGGGVLAIAVWLFRFLASRDRLATLPASELAGVSRSWQEWLRNAREAANRGDFREAVHSTYWAGIVRLEDTGVVPRDRTKTPREYLRLAAETAAGAMASTPAPQKPLADLTSRLERVWYARREARAEDFQESLRQLEALGCQLD